MYSLNSSPSFFKVRFKMQRDKVPAVLPRSLAIRCATSRSSYAFSRFQSYGDLVTFKRFLGKKTQRQALLYGLKVHLIVWLHARTTGHHASCDLSVHDGMVLQNLSAMVEGWYGLWLSSQRYPYHPSQWLEQAEGENLDQTLAKRCIKVSTRCVFPWCWDLFLSNFA